MSSSSKPSPDTSTAAEAKPSSTSNSSTIAGGGAPQQQNNNNINNNNDSGSDEQQHHHQGPRPLLASTKRPLMTHSKDGKLLSEKKLRRLEKNRLSARECRRRKREATENLERQINLLEGENLRLRLQLQIGEEAEDKKRQEEDKVMDEIANLLESGTSSEAEIYENIDKFKEKFADYGRDRRSAIEFHLRNIERLLMPTQTTTIAMRTLQGAVVAPTAATSEHQESSFVALSPTSTVESIAATSTNSSVIHPVLDTTSATAATTNSSGPPPQSQDPKALFQYLVNHLEVSPEQAVALKDSRFVAQELDSHLEKALNVVEELKTRLTQCGDSLEAEFDNVRAILTPTQSAKFLIWVANNGACMHMLNELWSRAYPATVINSAVGVTGGTVDNNNNGGGVEASPSVDGNSP